MHTPNTLLVARPIALLFVPALGAPADAQGFQTPGMPGSAPTGQTDQFSNEFNPAFSFVIDALIDYVDFAEDSEEDGATLSLAAVEFQASAWIDPSAWAYATIVAAEDEFGVEEAAVHYVGFDNNMTLRAGQFFVDFGKQMQAHLHELPYVGRPLVLREYLGEELAGTGVQFDDWFAAGGEGAIRFSLGAFASLANPVGLGREGTESDAFPTTQDRTEFGELSFTGRLTGFMDVGAQGVLQMGASGRFLPDFSFETEDGLSEEGLSNAVWGVDLTYGITDVTGLTGWTFGAEGLLSTGDLSAAVDDGGTPGDPGDDSLSVLDEDAFGYYLWIQRDLSRWHEAGFLFSKAERPELGLPEDAEYSLYYTRHLSEFHRLRLQLGWFDSDVESDAVALTLQYTAIVGPHAHGISW